MNLLLTYWVGVAAVWWIIGPIVERVVEHAMLRHLFAWNLAAGARLFIALLWPGLPVVLVLGLLSKDE